MGCFLPARHIIFIWETAWNRIFSSPKVCNVIRHTWNISRMAWRNVMIFFEDGKWHYIFGFMWFLSQSRWCFLRNFPKTVFLRFFYCFCKNDHLISKTGLGPYFSLPNQPIVWILWRMARQFGQNPWLKLLLWTGNKNGQLRCNGDLCLQQRQIRLQRDSPSLCIISLRSVHIWNTFPQRK